jgi:hypothetical protein
MNGLLSVLYVAKRPKWLLPPDIGCSASVARSAQKGEPRSDDEQSIPNKHAERSNQRSSAVPILSYRLSKR